MESDDNEQLVTLGKREFMMTIINFFFLEIKKKFQSKRNLIKRIFISFFFYFSLSIIQVTVATQTGHESPDLAFNPDKMTTDKHCYECKVRYKDPKPQDLVMYLHAWKYNVRIIYRQTLKKTEHIDPPEYCFLILIPKTVLNF